ncbi:MAG: Hint domain-containing protein [Cyanothece sp. SIO2G6]|nr:Hint domain-containing protein [Cyanothece sp. SIO2G6]
MALAAGDIAFIGFNGDSDNDFAIVVLEDINGSASAPVNVFFTANAWDGNTLIDQSEGSLAWTVDSSIVAGTVITFSDIKTDNATSNVGNLSGSMTLHTGNSGQYDQAILAFTGTVDTPSTFLAAIANSTFEAAGVSLNNTGLTVGNTALELESTRPSRPHFAEYKDTTTRIGTKTELLTSINNAQNWDSIRNRGDDSSGNLPFNTTSFIECFLKGTRILGDRGEIAVENLTIGDHILTATGQMEPIKWVGRQTVDPRQVTHPLRGYPIWIKAGALGDELPHRDLYVSPDHALLVEGLLINAGALVNGLSILETVPTEPFVYYHVELYQHSLLVAEGTATESYLPQRENRDWYDNGADYQALYPQGGFLIYWPMKYPRVSSKRQLPQFVRQRLLQVAQTLSSQTEVA